MTFSARKYNLERLENVLAYLKMKERIEKRYPRKWVAIARGRLVSIANTATKCVEKANLKAPGITHRFLYQVGAPLPSVNVREEVAVNVCQNREECRNNIINKIALGKLIRKAGGHLRDDYDNDRTCITLKGKTKCWKWLGKSAGALEESGVYNLEQCIEIVIDKLGTKEQKKTCALLDSGKSGPFMLMDAANFLDCASTAENPDDTEKGHTPAGDIPIRYGFVSVKIPQVGFAIKYAYVATNKDKLKEEVERRAEEEKQKQEEKEKEEEEKKKKLKKKSKSLKSPG